MSGVGKAMMELHEQHPLKIAWAEYRQTPEYKQSADVPDETLLVVQDVMWSAFVHGFWKGRDGTT